MANSAQPAPINLTVDKNYDSEFCGSIPLHLVNLIQPYGYLLMLDEQLRIIQASENAPELFALPLEEVLGQSLAPYLSEEQFQMLREKTLTGDGQDAIPVSLTFLEGKQGYHAVLHRQEHHFLLELEIATTPPAEASFTRVFEQIKTFTARLKATADTLAAATVAAQEMKAFSGFDRILLYQFDPQWNGMVIAEAKEESMDSLLDLRFPASDVPKQARDLYFKNPYRMIPDRDYTPVRLLPVINPLTHRFTDLSATNLRGVAPVHLEYLQNLSIAASLSLPIIMEDRLWGLISCHHRSARLPGYQVRSALELMAGIVSAQLAAKEKEQSIGLKAQLGDLHARLVSQLYATEDFPEALLSGPVSVLDLLSLSGAVLVYDGTIRTSGQVPPTPAIQELVAWLRRNHPETRFVTDTLPKEYPTSRSYNEVASGLIALAINASQGEYLLGLRPEVRQTVSWGGDPNQAIQREADGKTYHPRNSFATYQETIRDTASPWEPEQVAAGEALQHALLARIIQEKH